jgi:ABC-2 type transport system ATP-binding protein
MMDAIRVDGLRVQYGKFTAVDDLSFSVKKGEIFGLIGPNGAGKTSTLECIEGFRKSSKGKITILGHDSNKRDFLYSKMGIQLQETKFQDNIKVNELLDLYRTFYATPADTDELLKNFDLFEKKGAFVKKLSGGQRQKLAIILALVGNPEILILDEISTGLDPHARVQIWNKVKGLRDNGKTILLTTHFMEEAEYLCNRVGLIVNGKMKAIGTLPEMVEQADLKISVTAYAQKSELTKLASSVAPTGVDLDLADEYATVTFTDAHQISAVMAWICGNIQVEDLDLYKPNLEDVFLKLTGTKLEDKK